MEAYLTVIGMLVAGAIICLAVGVAIYKWRNNTKADLSPRKDKEF